MTIPSFLDALDRVTTPRYLPTDGRDFTFDEYLAEHDFSVDDILRARLKTLGMSFPTEGCPTNLRAKRGHRT